MGPSTPATNASVQSVWFFLSASITSTSIATEGFQEGEVPDHQLSYDAQILHSCILHDFSSVFIANDLYGQ